MNIKNLLWDFDNVFLHNNHIYSHYFLDAEKVAKECGIDISANEIETRWLKSQSTDNPYEMSTDVLVYEFNVSRQRTQLLIHHFLIECHTNAFSINEDLVSEVKKLEYHNNVIVTHASKQWIDYWLEKINLTSFFSGAFYVKDYNLCKHSQPETYPSVLDHFSMTSSNSYMVEDTERNLPFAADSGITPILYNDKASEHNYAHFKYSDANKLVEFLL